MTLDASDVEVKRMGIKQLPTCHPIILFLVVETSPSH